MKLMDWVSFFFFVFGPLYATNVAEGQTNVLLFRQPQQGQVFVVRSVFPLPKSPYNLGSQYIDPEVYISSRPVLPDFDLIFMVH